MLSAFLTTVNHSNVSVCVLSASFCFDEGIDSMIMKLICLIMEMFSLVSMQSIIFNYFLFVACRNTQKQLLSNDNEHNKQHPEM